MSEVLVGGHLGTCLLFVVGELIQKCFELVWMRFLRVTYAICVLHHVQEIGVPVCTRRLGSTSAPFDRYSVLKHLD